MCTIIFALNQHPNFKLIYLGNRDEFKSRPTAPSRFWDDETKVLAGRDLKACGTWLGITLDKRISFLTNYRDFKLIKENQASLGELTVNYLKNEMTALSYLETVKASKVTYNPYNLVVGTFDHLYFYSNIENEIIKIKNGVHGLSNAHLDSPWFKVEKAKKRLQNLIDSNQIDIEALFKILDDEEIPQDQYLPNTGIDIELERSLSSIFIDLETYGTLYKTVILVDKNDHVTYVEKFRDASLQWKINKIEY